MKNSSDKYIYFVIIAWFAIILTVAYIATT